jgi:hypothetical protein
MTAAADQLSGRPLNSFGDLDHPFAVFENRSLSLRKSRLMLSAPAHRVQVA